MTDIICSVLQFFTNLIVDHFPDLSVGSSQLGTISSSFETMIQFIAQVGQARKSLWIETYFILFSPFSSSWSGS